MPVSSREYDFFLILWKFSKDMLNVKGQIREASQDLECILYLVCPVKYLVFIVQIHWTYYRNSSKIQVHMNIILYYENIQRICWMLRENTSIKTLNESCIYFLQVNSWCRVQMKRKSTITATVGTPVGIPPKYNRKNVVKSMSLTHFFMTSHISCLVQALR